MTPVPACTIVSNNYLALARVLADSYREHHPGARVFACLVDRPHADVDYGALPFETVCAEDLGIAGFRALAFGYGILELNTAVKPFLLEFLREHRGLARVFYLDPDIQVFDRLTALEQALERGPLVLTPHITAPLDDARQPSERLVLLSGAYNLGFVGLRLDATTAPFLRWWQERLLRYCLHDVEHGLFVDQSWMDLAPSFLPDVQIARDPVFNVAYWNLAHRRPAFEGGRWRLEGRPLGFFHFSGLPLDDLERVSRYQDRIRLSERPELRPLFEDYRRRLLAAGHGTLRDLPYAYGRFADGRPVPDLARRVYQRVDPHGRRWPDAFAPGPQGFAAWLTEPLAFSGGMLTRAALSLWEENEDLRRRFPDPCGAQAQALAEHLRQGVAARGGLPHDFLDVLGGAEADALPADAPTPGERGDGPDPARPGALTAWWNEPMGALSERPLVTRFALHVHARRADARQVYPEPLGRDRRAFAYWFAVIGADEVDAADELVAPVRRSLGLRSRLSLAVRRFRRARAERTAAKVRPHAPAAVVEVSAAPAPFGVNLVARFDDPGDDGALARGTRAALQAGGIPVAEVALDRDARLDLLRGQFAPPQGLPYAVTLVHLSPGDTPRALERLPLAARAGSRVVGYWLWHLAHFPLDLAPSFAGLDEVWTPSRATAEAVRALSPLPVRCVPPGLDAGLGDAPPRAGGETLVWLSLADARTGVERFDLETLIKAFALACSRSPRPLELHLHLEGAGSGTLARLREISPGLAVKLDARCLTPVERAARLHDCDAFVTLARAEGLGLTALSALRLARPVVAADCGGPRDWLGTDTGFPVATRPARLDHGVAPFPRGAVWAAADVDSAVAALLAVSQGLDAAAARARVGQARVAEVYDAAPAARRWAEELRRLCDGPGA